MPTNYPTGTDQFAVDSPLTTGNGYPPTLDNVAAAVNRMQATKTPTQRITEAQGLKGENFYRGIAGASQAFTNQTVYFTVAGFYVGEIVTTLYFCCTGAIQTITTNKVAIYDPANGSRLAVSGNNTTNVATGVLGLNLTSPWTATKPAYVALLVDATTPGSFLRGGGTAGQTNAIGSAPLLGGTQAGQADMPATATVAASTAVAWVGWS